MAPKRKPFHFWTTCPYLPGELVNYISQNSRRIVYKTFIRHADLETLPGGRSHISQYKFASNWTVRFRKGSLPSGSPIYFFVWSGFEHVFVDATPDVPREMEVLQELAGPSRGPDGRDKNPEGGRRAGKDRGAGLVATDPSSAWKVLHHPKVLEQHVRALHAVRQHKVAVLIPCAATKPYRRSRSHSHGYLPALEGKKVDLWVLSDAMGVIPYAWSDSHPSDAYEFAPELLRDEARVEVVGRIQEWIEQQGIHYKEIYLALPRHHFRLVTDAYDSSGATANLFDASISACRSLGECPSTHYRATSRAYVDYLRRSVP